MIELRRRLKKEGVETKTRSLLQISKLKSRPARPIRFFANPKERTQARRKESSENASRLLHNRKNPRKRMGRKEGTFSCVLKVSSEKASGGATKHPKKFRHLNRNAKKKRTSEKNGEARPRARNQPVVRLWRESPHPRTMLRHIEIKKKEKREREKRRKTRRQP